MRILIIAGIALFAASAASSAPPFVSGFRTPVITPGGPKRADCPAISHYEAMKDKPERAARNLSELPPGDMYMAVYRRIDGCVVPIIASQPSKSSGNTKRVKTPERPAL